MGWEVRKTVPRPAPRCLHPGLFGAIAGVAMGTIGVGSIWKCDGCGDRWIVVSNGPGGPRKLEKYVRERETG